MDSSQSARFDTGERATNPIDVGASKRIPVGRGLLAGSFGALAMAGFSLWAGQRYGGVITAQLLADRVTGVTPVSIFGQVLQQLEENAKALTLLALTLAQVLAGAIIGAVYVAVLRWVAVTPARGAMLLGLAAWLILSLVAAPLGEIGLMARDAPGGAWETQLLFVASAAVFGVSTALALHLLAGGWTAGPVDLSRRRLNGSIATAALVAPSLMSGGYTLRHALRLRQTSSASPAPIGEDDEASAGDDGDPFAISGMPRFVTPTDEFYVVSKNIVDPTVDGATWTLEVDGLVRQKLTLSLSDLLAREAIEFTSTLECISNTVGGKYISNAVWHGVPLATLLGEAGLMEGIVDLELHAADGYIESIPLAEGLAPDTMVVHSMNGEPLNDKHGFPARLIVPGIYGMKNVKWLTKVVAVDSDIRGYWQQRGWSDPAPVLTMSRIDVPRSQGRVGAGEPFVAGGVAFAGDRGISRVEVSFDKGSTWHDADLSEVPSDLTWRLWRIDRVLTDEGSLDLHVRATDGRGEVQTSERRPALPNGSTGHHSIRLTVEGGDALRLPEPSTPTPDSDGGGLGDGG